MKDYQSVKWVINRQAIDIVNCAMDLFGVVGFIASNPLTRLYRDVRAGPFMQPYSPVDAREYVVAWNSDSSRNSNSNAESSQT